MNVLVRLKFAYYDVAAYPVSQYATEIPPKFLVFDRNTWKRASMFKLMIIDK